jgi:heme exporter protein D
MGARVSVVEAGMEKDVTEFFVMGGHGLYVWPAYGISLLVIVMLGVWPVLVRRRIDAMYQELPQLHPRGVSEDE